MIRDVIHHAVVPFRASLVVAVLLCTAGHLAIFAQGDLDGFNDTLVPELDGSWDVERAEDFFTDTVPVNYTGLPLNDESRARALRYSESTIGMYERQCQGNLIHYMFQGPFSVKIWSDFDVKGDVISYTLGAWDNKLPMVIWMDGRPRPSEYARHTRAGFTTGRWEGGVLVTRTTHLKEGLLRKNGPPLSKRTTVTSRFIRHGDLLTMVAIIDDPLYLAEPVIWSRDYWASSTRVRPVGPPCNPTFEGNSAEVPFFPGRTKPPGMMEEITKQFGIPRQAVMGYPETLYPEYRQKMQATATSGR